MKKKGDRRRKQTVGIVVNTIGFSILLGITLIFAYIFVGVIYYGGVMLYEPSRFMSIMELIVIIIGFIFLVYLFKKKLWDDKF